MRLTADFDAIPLFSRGTLKQYPILSAGLQDLLQTFLLQAYVSQDAGAAGTDLMIAEEEESSATSAASASIPTPPPRSKRYSTGSRFVEELLNVVDYKGRASIGNRQTKTTTMDSMEKGFLASQVEWG